MPTIAAVSDLHLGDPTCYLSVSSVRQKFLDALSSYGTTLDALFLVGDIMDLTVGRCPEPWVATKEFFAWLFSQNVRIDRVFYLPGNHDHHLWTILVEHEEILSQLASLTRLSPGEELDATPAQGYGYHTPLHELFPESVQQKVSFKYPFHDFILPSGTRFVFHHGHYFDGKIAPLARLVAKCYRSLRKVEGFNHPYIETMFYAFSWNRTLQELELGCYHKMAQLHAAIRGLLPEALRKLTPAKPTLGRCELGRIEQLLRDVDVWPNTEADEHIWVFGHTHACESRTPPAAMGTIQMFDLGGWVLNRPVSEKTLQKAWSTPGVLVWNEVRNATLVKIDLDDYERGAISSKALPISSSSKGN